MACPAVLTGQRFVAQSIAHIDCQAQAIGAYGYGALADPGSAVSLMLAALLSIFIAIFGLRMMMNEPIAGRDLVADVLRVGIVLTLATSWPAWRVLGYDLVLRGPAEIAAPIATAAGLSGEQDRLASQLQNADDGIVLLTISGTGRATGGANRSDTIGDSFRSIALADQDGLANGRIAFLVGTLAPLALLRLGGGILLALAPLMAGLLLFAGTRDLFFGWLRGLGGIALGALALRIVLGVELAVLGPWLSDALAQRQAEVVTPSMPTELVVITSAFALATFGILALIARIAFFGGFQGLRIIPAQASVTVAGRPDAPGLMHGRSGDPDPPRAFGVAEAVTQAMRREESGAGDRRLIASHGAMRASELASPRTAHPSGEALGSSFSGGDAPRRRRTSGASERRDHKA